MKNKILFLPSILLDFLIDFALIGMGYLIYYHFFVAPLAPVDLNPIITQLFGNKVIFEMLMAGVPFIIGLLNLARTVLRILTTLKLSFSKSNEQ